MTQELQMHPEFPQYDRGDYPHDRHKTQFDDRLSHITTNASARPTHDVQEGLQELIRWRLAVDPTKADVRSVREIDRQIEELWNLMEGSSAPRGMETTAECEETIQRWIAQVRGFAQRNFLPITACWGIVDEECLSVQDTPSLAQLHAYMREQVSVIRGRPDEAAEGEEWTDRLHVSQTYTRLIAEVEELIRDAAREDIPYTEWMTRRRRVEDTVAQLEQNYDADARYW